MEKRCKLCRAEGQKLFLKGSRCFSDKCSISRRQSSPGQHGQARKKSSEYGIQLRAKQKTKRYYGILENQFRHYYDMALKIKEGKTGENMLSLIERRLDNVVYRLGLCSTRREGRQLVNHAHFTVNGKKVNIPSYIVKVGDVIAVSDGSKDTNRFKAIAENDGAALVPKWLEKTDKLSGKVIALPARDDIDYPVEEHLIVELYSK